MRHPQWTDMKGKESPPGHTVAQFPHLHPDFTSFHAESSGTEQALGKWQIPSLMKHRFKWN